MLESLARLRKASVASAIGSVIRVALHARLGDRDRAADHVELAGFEAGQHARPRQVDEAHLHAHLLADFGEEVLVEARLLTVLEEVERRELHLRADD